VLNPDKLGVVPELEILVQVELVAFMVLGSVPATEASTGTGMINIGASTITPAIQMRVKRAKLGRFAMATRQKPNKARNFGVLTTPNNYLNLTGG
jgi:hypothetical protein